MKNFWVIPLLVVFAASGPVLAGKMPILTDSTVTTTAEILNRIQADAMALIKVKYNDLQKNFTPNYLTTGLDLDCRTGVTSLPGNPQYAGLRISNSSKVLADGLVQSFSSVSHFDCYGQLIFTERISAVGLSPVAINVSDAVKFVRLFEVQTGEMARQYQIENAHAETVFSIHSRRANTATEERIYSAVEVVGIKWLELNQIDPSANERRIYSQLNSGIFNINGSKYRMTFKNNGSMIFKTLWTDRLIEQTKDDFILSQADYDSYLVSSIEGLTSSMLSQILAGFILKMPETKKVQVGVSDSPFLRELQLNYNRMQTNTEPDQVKLFFQKAIEDIKTGRLKVD